MTTKMVIYEPDEHIKVFVFGIDYTNIKVVEGILYIYLNDNVEVAYAKNFWKRIEFNRDNF